MSMAIVGSVAVAGISAYGANKSAKAANKTTTQEMDPTVRPYIFGEQGGPKGLLDFNRESLERSQTPERLQGWQNIMDRGQGLLGGSVAGNPFSSGYKGGAGLFGNAGGLGGGMGSMSGGNGLPQFVPQPLPQVQQPVMQSPQFSMDDIMAEWQRRQQQQQAQLGQYMSGDTGGNGGGADGGSGPGGDGPGGW